MTISKLKLGGVMTKRERRAFNPEFKFECAQLVLELGLTYKETCERWAL